MGIDLGDKAHIQAKLRELQNAGAIQTSSKTGLLIGLMAKKANNNLKLARTIFDLSKNEQKKESMGLMAADSFFDWVIITAYYAMFHMAHAILATKKVKIKNIRVHEATLVAFAHHFIVSKELEADMFFIYEDAEGRAEQLFNSLSDERRKRGHFTYEKLPKANMDPAQESLENATRFVQTLETILLQKKFL